MARSRILIIALLSLIFGIFLSPYFNFVFWADLVAIVVLMAVAIYFRREALVFIFAFVVAFIIFGIFYGSFFKTQLVRNETAKFLNRKAVLEGYISQPADVKADKTNLTLTAEKIRWGEKSKKINAKVLVYAKKYPSHDFGDYISVSGFLREPPVFEDFNYRNYLARYQIYAVMFAEEIRPLKKEPQFNFWGKTFFSIEKSLFAVKAKFESKINQILPEPQGAFLDGLLLGVKKFLPANLLDDFASTGTTHIIVISGFNITIIIKFFMFLTKRWSRKAAYLIAISGILAFIIMTGAGPSIIRAGIMATILMWAEREGRRSDATIALLLAAVIMIFINPLILRFDIGFQLSFLATAGLIYFSPLLENWLAKSRLKKAPKILTEAGVATISAQVFVLPILLINFGRLSLIAPVANILVLPVIPLTMLLGFIAVIAAFIFLPLGQLVGGAAWLFLSYIILVIQKCADIPGASFNVGKLSWIWLAVYYFILTVFLSIYYLRQRKLAEESEEDEKDNELQVSET
jgi:competence protein ComEC